MVAKSFFAVKWFFNAPKVVKAVDRATRRVLSKFGGYVRQTSRRSIRKPRKKKISELTSVEKRQYRRTGERPTASAKRGKPPRSQTGRLKKTILFWYNPSEQSVTIGPARFPGRDRIGALEKGGATRSRGKKPRNMQIQPHPFMGPALIKELPKLEPMWANSVRSK